MKEEETPVNGNCSAQTALHFVLYALQSEINIHFDNGMKPWLTLNDHNTMFKQCLSSDENGQPPEVEINGVPAKELAKEEKSETQQLLQPPEIGTKVEDLVLEVENEPEDTSKIPKSFINMSMLCSLKSLGNPLDKNLRSRTFEEQVAMKGNVEVIFVIGMICFSLSS